MLYTKFEGHQLSGFKEGFFKGFLHIRAWQLTFESHDQDHFLSDHNGSK